MKSRSVTACGLFCGGSRRQRKGRVCCVSWWGCVVDKLQDNVVAEDLDCVFPYRCPWHKQRQDSSSKCVTWAKSSYLLCLKFLPSAWVFWHLSSIIPPSSPLLFSLHNSQMSFMLVFGRKKYHPCVQVVPYHIHMLPWMIHAVLSEKVSFPLKAAE